MSDEDAGRRPDEAIQRSLMARRGWPSRTAFLRAVLRAKWALDRIEDEAGTRVARRAGGFGTEEDDDAR